MNYRNVEYSITLTSEPNIWRWKFRIGKLDKTGRTQAKLELLAVRRVQQLIDRELKRLERDPD